MARKTLTWQRTVTRQQQVCQHQGRQAAENLDYSLLLLTSVFHPGRPRSRLTNQQLGACLRLRYKGQAKGYHSAAVLKHIWHWKEESLAEDGKMREAGREEGGKDGTRTYYHSICCPVRLYCAEKFSLANVVLVRFLRHTSNVWI